MANIKLRLSIHTIDRSIDITSVANQLPNEGLKTIYRIGESSNKNINKESSIDYIYYFNEIDSLDECNKLVIKEWSKHQFLLKDLTSTSFKAYILFEFDMDNCEVFPEIIFKADFLNLISFAGIELQLYFYPK